MAGSDDGYIKSFGSVILIITVLNVPPSVVLSEIAHELWQGLMMATVRVLSITCSFPLYYTFTSIFCLIHFSICSRDCLRLLYFWSTAKQALHTWLLLER